jgi:DNA-binding NarL/FixJ family response regulator
MPPVRILIVEDHPVVRKGLSQVIAADSGMEVCGQAADATEAFQLVQSKRPHVVIVDLLLKSGDGMDLIGQIKNHDPQIKMIVSSAQEESIFAERALRAGAMGYVSKGEPADAVLEAIRTVARGEVHLSPAMANQMLKAVVAGRPPQQSPVESLTNRELMVFEMIGQGLSTKQIANKLHLSHKTIETHRDKIKAKLGLGNTNELGRRAVEWVLKRR